MKKFTHSTIKWICIVSGLFLSGCSLLKHESQPAPQAPSQAPLPAIQDFNVIKQVATDVVDTVVSLGDYVEGVVEITGNNPFINAYVSQQLGATGVAVSDSDGSGGSLMNLNIAQSGDRVTMSTHYRFLEISRDYNVADGELTPLYTTRIEARRGEPVSYADTTDQASETLGKATGFKAKMSLAEEYPPVEDFDFSDEVAASEYVSLEPEAVSPQTALPEEPVLAMLNTKNNQFAGQIPVHRANMATLGQSNYQSLFADYPATKAEILVFPDDSLVLGKNNKRTIEELAELFNPETDLISVVGCSNGTTKLVNGNALLANGRASRVREELIMASIDPTLILEEACWSGAWTSDVPARGVILTLRSRS